MVTSISPHGSMDLPEEIWILIVTFLDTDSLARTALVSRHFNDLAEPFLYRRQKVMQGCHASALSAAIYRRNERVRWIDSLLVSTKFGDDRGLEDLPHHLQDMHNLKRLVLETPDCNKQLSANRVPWISLQDRYERVFESASILAPISNVRVLPNLQECTLHFVDYRSALYSLTKYPTIFLHPTLRSLTISCTSLDFLDRYPLQLQTNTRLQRSTALEHLHLEECDINASTLAMLLNFPRSLRSIKISEGIRYDGDLMPFGSVRRHGNVHPQHLTEALAYTCADSLETLSLSLGYRHEPDVDTIQPSNYLRMTMMEKLLQLEVDLRTLDLFCSSPECDHETSQRFPPSMETLKISGIPFGTVFNSQRQKRPTMVPLPECLVREKSRHGISNLSKVVYTYEYYADTDKLDSRLATVINHSVLRSTSRRQDRNDGMIQLPADAGNVALVDGGVMMALLNDPRFGTILNNQPAMAPEILGLALMDPYLRVRGPQQEFTRIESSMITLLDKLNDIHLPRYRETNTELQIDLFVLPRGFIPPYLSTEDKPQTVEAWWASTKQYTSEDLKATIRAERANKPRKERDLVPFQDDVLYPQHDDDFTTDDEPDDDMNDHDWIDEHEDHEDEEGNVYHLGEGGWSPHVDDGFDEEDGDSEDSMYVDAES